MRMIAAVAMVCLAWASASAQMTPIKRWTIGPGPSFGCPENFSAPMNGRWYDLAVLPGASPSGADALRITTRPTSETGDRGWGCAFRPETAPIPDGSVRYARWRQRFVPPVDLRSDSSAAGPRANARTTFDKLFIAGNLSGDNSRMIYHIDAPAPDRNAPVGRITQGTGSTAPRAFGTLPVGQWNHIQIKIVSGRNGAAYQYINNNNEARPDTQEVNISIGTRGWGPGCPDCFFLFGDGSFNAPSNNPPGRGVMDLADFEWDDEFDPQWARGAGTPPPSPVDCVVSTWVFASTTEWGACVAGTQTRVETWRRAVTTEPANGGAACPALVEIRTGSQSCAMPVDPCVTAPITVAGIAWPGASEGARSGRFTWDVAGAVVALQSVEWLWAPQRLRISDSRGCSVTVPR